MDQDRFKQLLQAVLSGEHVKEATAKLKKEYYPNPEALSLLLQILLSEEPAALRQLAATQARSLARRHWSKVPDAQRPNVRNALLQSALHEPHAAVRHAVSRVIAVIASLDFADGEWADLPQSMVRAAAQPDAKQREVGTYIILVLLDEMTPEQTAQLGPLFEVLARTIRDPESAEVRATTVQCLAKIAHGINADEDRAALGQFHQALPGMIGVLKDAMARKSEEHTAQCFEALQDLLDDDSRVLGQHFKDLMDVMAAFAGEASLDKDVRTQALNFLMNALVKQKSRFQKLKLAQSLLQTLWNILLRGDGSDPKDDASLAFSAVSLVNIMAASLPPSQVVGPIVQGFISSSDSQDPREKLVAATLLAASIEGAPDFVDQHTEAIIPQLLKLMHDPDIKVRKAGVEACNELAECVPEGVAKQHQTVMAALGKNLTAAVGHLDGDEASSNTAIAVSCCQGIEALVRGIATRELAQYLSELVPPLRNLFGHPDLKIKQTAIGAVGSIAAQAKKAFEPYFADTMLTLQDNIQAKGSEDALDLRAVTLDTMGSFALALGPEAFKPYVQVLMQASEEALHLDSPMLKESSYMFWGTLATVYKEDFGHYLPGVTKALLEELEEFDPSLQVEAGAEDDDLMGKEIVVGGRKVKIVGKGEASGGAGDDDVEEVEIDDDDDDDDWDDIADLNALEEGQEMALDSIAQIFTKVGPAYLAHFPRTIETVTKLLEHPVENVRKAAMVALGAAYEALWLLQPDGHAKWEPGLPLQAAALPELDKLRDVIVTAALTTYKTETDSDIISGVNQTLASAMKICGPHVIAGPNVMAKLVPTLFAILCKEHPCQQLEDDDLDDDEEADSDEERAEDEDSEDAFAVIDSALDAVAGLAAALGPQFGGKPWSTFREPLAAACTAATPAHRAAAVGALAECVRGCKAGVTPHATALLKLFSPRAAEADAQVRSNAVYGLGLLAEHADDPRALDPMFPALPQKALEVLQRAAAPAAAADALGGGVDAREADNWAGCLARLARRRPADVPLAAALRALAAALPLREDFEEHAPVWGLVVAMYRGEGGDEARAALGPLTEHVMAAAEEVLADADEQLPREETRAEVLQLVRFVRSKSPGLVDARPGLVQALAE